MCFSCAKKAYAKGDYMRPLDNFGIQLEGRLNLAKAALLEAMRASSEDHVTVFRKPDQKVVVTSDFKEGAFTLTAFSSTLFCNFDKKGKALGLPPPNSVALGEVMNMDGKSVQAWAMNGNRWPKEASQSMDASTCIVPYWLIGASVDKERVNVAPSKKTITAKCGSISMTLEVPVWINTDAIKAGCVIVRHDAKNAKPEIDEAEEPPRKKASPRAWTTEHSLMLCARAQQLAS